MPWYNLESNSVKADPSEGVFSESQTSAFEFLNLSRQQRLMAFGGCLVGGFAISLVGSILFATGSIPGFALLYVIGLIVSLIGTGFLIGFKKQVKLMFKPVRVIAAGIFLGSIVIVFIAAFAIHSDILVIIFAVVTYLAYAWYCLSYIPFAQNLAKKMFGQVV